MPKNVSAKPTAALPEEPAPEEPEERADRDGEQKDERGVSENACAVAFQLDELTGLRADGIQRLRLHGAVRRDDPGEIAVTAAAALHASRLEETVALSP